MSPFMRLGLLVVAGAIGGSTGCATEPLRSSAPSGVNLTGVWKFNLGLSDDPNGEPDTEQGPAPQPGGHHRGRGGPGGMSGPGGGLGGDQGIDPAGDDSGGPQQFRAPGLEQSQPLPSLGGGAPSADPSRRSSPGHALQIPERLAITQNGNSVAIRANLADGTATADEYTAGVKSAVAFGGESAEREVGWRGPVLVVSLKGKKIDREYDYAMDDDGHLIVTIQGKGRRGRPIDVKSVYDRVRG
jgi:hypothetical protein